MRKDLRKLIQLIEPQIIGILITKGLITTLSKNFSDMELTVEGKARTGESDELISNEWIEKWRDLWPVSHKGNKEVIRSKLNRFLLNHDYTIDDILEATQIHLNKNSPPYCGNANYFFYKKDKKEEISRCLEILEETHNDMFITKSKPFVV